MDPSFRALLTTTWSNLNSESAAAQAVLPAVVAVRTLNDPQVQRLEPGGYGPYSSGVIVTEDGIVLSQWHVSHERPSKENEDGVSDIVSSLSLKAGARPRVILHDGRECPAELLGADISRDLSLLRPFLQPGPFPCVPLDPQCEVQLGDWVLKVGHPLGYRQGRSSTVRLGRVLAESTRRS